MSAEQEPDSNLSTLTQEEEQQQNEPIKVVVEYVEPIPQSEFMEEISTPTNEVSTLDEEDNELKNITENLTKEDRQDVETPKPSRELKLLLALSKEANLDTNIAHKRKSVETVSKSDGIIKRRSSTDAQDDIKTPHNENSDLHHTIPEIMGINPNDLEISTSDNVDSKETKDKDKETSGSKPKKIIGGAVDENGRRTKKLSSSFVTINNEVKDPFCWQCHHEDPNLCCKSCPRSFHQKCLKQSVSQPNHWMCPECATIMQAENLKQRSSAMQDMTLVHLCVLLKYALKRMIQVGGCEPFIHPVNDEDFPDYKDYIVHPMDLTCLEKNIKRNTYGSPQAFEADAKWILHNSIIFNSYQSKLTSVAKSLIKICKQEMNEIENCATCYLNANTKKKTWFIEVCPKPHTLVWAKLKGFPYWPAKAMRTNQAGLVDVRFFGAHDRAWIHHKECFLFSLKDPNSNKQKKNDIIQSVKELQLHVENLKKVYGQFQYAPYRVPFEPEQQSKQLQLMLPGYPNKARVRRSSVKSKTNGSVDQNEEPKNTENDKELESNDSDMDDDMNETLAVHKSKLLTSSTSSEENHNSTGNDSSDTVESKSPFNRNVRGATVRMRGGIMNFSGKIKILPKIVTPEQEKRKRDSSDEPEIPNKLARRNSEQSDISLQSNASDKISKVDITENMEITIGNTSKSIQDTPEKDTSNTNSDTTPENRHKSPIEVNVGLNKNAEISISHIKSKISDRLMIKLSEDTSSGTKPKDSKSQDAEMIQSTSKNHTADDLYLTKLKNKDLTVLEKVTELSPDADIFDNTEVNTDDKDFIQGVSNHTLCTEEIELDDKDNILINFERTLAAVDSSESTSKTNDENRNDNELQKENSNLNLDNDNNKNSDESGKDSVVTSTSTEEPMVTETQESENEKTSTSENQSTTLTSSTPDQDAEKQVESSDNVIEESSGSIQTESNKNIDKDLSSNVVELNSLQRNKVTIVNVEDIRKRNLDKPSPPITPQSILENRLSVRRQSNVSEKDTVELDPTVVVVKSEPSSEDEPSDSEYLEKKRKYLSALNISERMPKRPKINEIRTRSKTEDKKFKIVDNISQVIDDVASHYSLNHANDAVTITRTTKKKEIFVKPLPSLQDLKPRARKSFPTIKNVYPSQKKEPVKLCKAITTPISSVKSPPTSVTIMTKPSDVITTNNLVMITAAPPVNTAPLVSSNQPIGQSQTITKPIITMVQHSNGSAVGNILLPTQVTLPAVFNTNIESQNYIPQSGALTKTVNVNTPRTPALATTSSTIVTTIPSMAPLSLVANSTFNVEHPIQSTVIEEVQTLTSSIPEPLSRSISDIMNRTPPRLKPRPPGPLSTQFSEGLPSSAGTVTSKVNSISHRLGDYFRGMLIELLKDLGSSSNSEAEIARLKLENEELKHRHTEEILEIKKNISSVLKDMQKSLTDEKNRVLEETRSACELETVKRVEEAKSKQWCASCSKEAQFYCCWNTSYCDYPCQQKHWPSHMSKCTQQLQNPQMLITPTTTTAVKVSTPQPLVLRQTTPPKGFKTTAVLGKSAKVLLNRPLINKVPLNFSRTSTTSHITLVESTPGNYELVGNGGPISVGGKLFANLGKIKSGSVISVTSTSNSNADAVIMKKTVAQTQATPSISRNSSSDGKTDGV